MILLDCPQYSDEWWQSRVGIPTSSNFDKIVTSTGQKSKSWSTFAYKLVGEKLSGKCEDSYSSAWMDRGKELEAEARKAYEFYQDRTIIEVGAVYRNEKRLWSCSPDGIGLPTQTDKTKGGLELKCPNQGTQSKYLHKKVLPLEYRPQVYGSLWICDELEWWDFFSYHPDMPYFLIRVDRNDEGYKVYSEALDKFMPQFIKDVDNIIKDIGK